MGLFDWPITKNPNNGPQGLWLPGIAHSGTSEKKVPGSNPVVCRVKFPLAHFPMALSGLVCFCCCCTSGKYIGNKQLSKFILDVYPLKTTLIYENFNQLYKLVGT
jgi:hypothetical protein